MKTLGALSVALAAGALPSACASLDSGAPDRIQGTSGPVAWEVVDVRTTVTADRSGIRWNYTLVLKDKVGKRIQFETSESTARTNSPRRPLIAATHRDSFQRVLEAHAELRVNLVYSVVFTAGSESAFGDVPGGREGVTVSYQFHGKDDSGRPVTVNVHVPLDPGLGKQTPAAVATGPMPPAKALQPSELRGLAGKWRGHYRDDHGFETPVEVTILSDGSFHAAEGDPVRNRFRGSLNIRDGQIVYSARTDTGILTLHETAEKRILRGDASGKREGRSDQPGAAPYTFTYALRLESGPAIPAPRSGKEQPAVTIDPPVLTPGDRWAFRSASSSGKSEFVWFMDREETVDGVDYYVLALPSREIYWRKADLAYYMDKVGPRVEERAVPPVLRYVWPLTPGKKWEQRFTTERPLDRRTWETAMTCEVEAEETTAVPAGTFSTFKIVCLDQRTGSVLNERWYSPEVKSWVRERVRFSHGIRERELTSFTLK